MLHITICDDQSDQIICIKDAVENYFSQKEEKPHIDVYTNPLLFLENMEQIAGGVVDIALLDICMPGILGTDVAREIRKKQSKTEIIFLTTSDEYAVDAFELKATHYLLKPFTKEKFNTAMDRAMISFETKNVKNMVLKSESGTYIVDINDICYIESQRHILSVYTEQQCFYETRRSLERFLAETEELLPGKFILCYKGYLVNQDKIAAIEKEQIVLKNGVSVPIPKRKNKEIQNRYFDYMFSKNKGETV